MLGCRQGGLLGLIHLGKTAHHEPLPLMLLQAPVLTHPQAVHPLLACDPPGLVVVLFHALPWLRLRAPAVLQ